MRRITLGALRCLPLFVTTPLLAANVTIDPTQAQARISPYVYGANQVDGSSVKFTAWRQGGNRMTGYNWENNYSHAGSDWQFSSDTYLCDTPATCSTPGATITQYVDAARAASAYSLVTLQMAGYVSADADGTVTEAEVAPSARWMEVVPKKGSAFLLSPNLNDDQVYMDELVNFLVQRYGRANQGGILGYSLDNEPDLWSSTHARIHPDACGAAELVERSAALAAAVKGVDASAEIFGFVSYGYAGYLALQDAADWVSVKGDYEWYVQYFLAQMAAASQQAGLRLLDVLDLHYYSEARGDDTRVQEGTTANAAARVQSTRSLWDPSYDFSATDPTVGENSWITEWNDAIALIPRVQGYIRDRYPGTKFAITEYDFGAADHISGGIAEADALGIFGREGVYFASRWGDPGRYTDAAYQLYLNYDGKGSGFGDISVKAASSDVINVPTYAALDEANPNLLHVILINRDLASAQTASVTIIGSTVYGDGQVWGFDASSATLTDRGAVAVTSNAFSLSLPALSAMHVVLTGSAAVPVTGLGGAGGATLVGVAGTSAKPGGSGGTSGGGLAGAGPVSGGNATTVAAGAGNGLGGGGGNAVAGASNGTSAVGIAGANVAALGGATSASGVNSSGAAVGGAKSAAGASSESEGATKNDETDNGCGCRLATRAEGSRSAWALLALLALLRRRRR